MGTSGTSLGCPAIRLAGTTTHRRMGVEPLGLLDNLTTPVPAGSRPNCFHIDRGLLGGCNALPQTVAVTTVELCLSAPEHHIHCSRSGGNTDPEYMLAHRHCCTRAGSTSGLVDSTCHSTPISGNVTCLRSLSSALSMAMQAPSMYLRVSTLNRRMHFLHLRGIAKRPEI